MNRTKTIPPNPLKKGDVVGIVAPAGQITDKARFEKGVRILTEMGFEPRFPTNMWPGTGYLADTDVNRAQEFNKVYFNQEVKAVMCARGGYGSLRLLNDINFKNFHKEPKAVIGFSDITLLLGEITRSAGMSCFHGPVVTSLCDCTPQALEQFYYSITGNWNKPFKATDVEILRPDDVSEGILIGGNLSTLLTTLATPFENDWKGKVLLLEDIGEPIYRLDRMLTQLSLTGKLDNLSGLLIGDFSLNPEQDSLEKIRYTEYVWNRILELTAKSSFPVWGNIPAGHCNKNYTLTIGAMCSMDSGSGTLNFS